QIVVGYRAQRPLAGLHKDAPVAVAQLGREIAPGHQDAGARQQRRSQNEREGQTKSLRAIHLPGGGNGSSKQQAETKQSVLVHGISISSGGFVPVKTEPGHASSLANLHRTLVYPIGPRVGKPSGPSADQSIDRDGSQVRDAIPALP